MKEVQLDEKLHSDVERIVREKPELGYLNAEEFIRDAVRMSFRKIEIQENY